MKYCQRLSASLVAETSIATESPKPAGTAVAVFAANAPIAEQTDAAITMLAAKMPNLNDFLIFSPSTGIIPFIPDLI